MCDMQIQCTPPKWSFFAGTVDFYSTEWFSGHNVQIENIVEGAAEVETEMFETRNKLKIKVRLVVESRTTWSCHKLK